MKENRKKIIVVIVSLLAVILKTVILDNSTPLDDLRDVVGRGGMLNLGNALISTYLQYIL